MGFLGVLLVLALFTILVCRGLRLSLKAPDSFGSYLALGLTLLIGLPALINMGVVSGILPTKGLSLPFLSYGGSSLLVNLLAVGILLNISSQVKFPLGPRAQSPQTGGSGRKNSHRDLAGCSTAFSCHPERSAGSQFSGHKGDASLHST